MIDQAFTFHFVSGTIECCHADDLSKGHSIPSLQTMLSILHTRHHARVGLGNENIRMGIQYT